jgi:nucleoside phosphorylase
VILCGIAGGIQSPGKTELGDIIVAEQTVLYEASKIIRKQLLGVSFGTMVERRLSSFPAGDILLRTARHLQVSSWPAPVMRKLSGRRAPRVLFGPIASGEKVVADSAFLAPLVQAYPLLKGIEMEGGGVASAAHAATPHCESLLVKSICDWADHKKNDDWHEAAAYAAATFVKALILRLSDTGSPATANGQSEPVPSVNGLFIEFLNPESQRIYGIDTADSDDRIRHARAAINAALLLCPAGTVFPVGTILETPYLQFLLAQSMPLLMAGKVRLSMREDTVAEFLEKRRSTYKDVQNEYPSLFDDPKVSLPPVSFVRKETYIGDRIAQIFRQGPQNLADWKSVEAIYSPNDLATISAIPADLLAMGKPVTWGGFAHALHEHGLEANPELRKLLQLTYCNIYVSEYGLEYLRNVDYAPFQILSPSKIRRYDFHSLRRVLGAFGIWRAISRAAPKDLLRLLESTSYARFLDTYDLVFGTPIDDLEFDALVDGLKAAARTSTGSHFRRDVRSREMLADALARMRSALQDFREPQEIDS